MDNIEKHIIETGDKIGAALDQEKIKIYDWNDKIIKNVKKFDKMKKTKKKSTKEEVKSNRIFHNVKI